MTKVHGKRYAYKFDFHGLMAACQAQAQGCDPTSSMISSYKHHHHAAAGGGPHGSMAGQHGLPHHLAHHSHTHPHVHPHAHMLTSPPTSSSSLGFPSPSTASSLPSPSTVPQLFTSPTVGPGTAYGQTGLSSGTQSTTSGDQAPRTSSSATTTVSYAEQQQHTPPSNAFNWNGNLNLFLGLLQGWKDSLDGGLGLVTGLAQAPPAAHKASSTPSRSGQGERGQERTVKRSFRIISSTFG